MQFTHSYQDIISVENLLEAWKEFLRDKRARSDVQYFGRHLMRNVFHLRSELAAGTYRHSAYEPFNISDPKPRNIHKAAVRDRLLHHALCRKLHPFFDRAFIYDSYSCRVNKGVHKAINRFRAFAYKSSQNHTRTVRVLKCDVRKFFASIDHELLLQIIRRYIPDKNIVGLLSEIIDSFETSRGVGLPLGNLTSQLLVNVYMNEFDQFVKHHIKAKHYVRYADDFVFLSYDQEWLEGILPRIEDFLWSKLHLTLHPDKISICTFVSGVDFLGWVHFPDHRVLRTTTKRRMFNRLAQTDSEATRESYRGLLSHGNARKIRRNFGLQ